jgi:hypothetical protein
LKRIAIDCLNCGHTASMAEVELARFGVEPDASLVLVTRKLVCSRCGSKAVRAYRYIDDELQPVFQGPPVAPKE